MSQVLKQSIKLTLRTINHAIKQLPQDKQMIITPKISEILKKYPNRLDNDEGLKKFLKDLQFNLNFIKLSNPQLDFVPPEEKQKQQEKKEDEQLFSHEMPKDFDFEKAQQKSKYVREEVQFSNWFDGNADPELLRKHKDLLVRQSFGGDYWKDQGGPPQSQSQHYLRQIMKNQPEQPPEKTENLKSQQVDIEQGEQYWQKVKR